MEYTYDGSGLRRTKTSGGVTKTYDYENGRLVRESGGEEPVRFLYGEGGIIGIKYDRSKFLFRKNAFGDVTEVYNVRGELVAKYSYSAYGKCTIEYNKDNAAYFNPIRYRGYYYDEETGLYYLKSRYYDPETGRFLNADDISYLDPETINGLNLYAYCGNNPVMNVDPNGTFFLSLLIGALIGFTVSFATSAITQAAFNGGAVNWGTALIDGVFGAISGALWVIPGLGAVATGLINAGLTAINGVITTGIESDWQFSAMDFLSIGISSLVSGLVSGATRNQFLKVGRQILKDTNELVGTVSKRIITGYYNNGIDIFSKSFKSAFGQMWSQVMGINFGKGFWKDWLITLLQAISSTSFSRGLNGLQW